MHIACHMYRYIVTTMTVLVVVIGMIIIISVTLFMVCMFMVCRQCFDTVGWASGRASGL